MRAFSTILCAGYVLLCSCSTERHASERATARLYRDFEIRRMAERFKDAAWENPNPDREAYFLGQLVPAGQTKKLKRIFAEIGLDPKRLEKPQTGGMNMVRTYRWRVSPFFQLSIMTATNDPENDHADLWSLKGYGVCLAESYER